MQNKSARKPIEKNNYKTLKTDQEKNFCEDGFCAMPNNFKNQRLDEDNGNLFDPV